MVCLRRALGLTRRYGRGRWSLVYRAVVRCLKRLRLTLEHTAHKWARPAPARKRLPRRYRRLLAACEV